MASCFNLGVSVRRSDPEKAASVFTTGTRIGYDDFGYGGDCEMTVVADKKILEPATRAATLDVRCKGDDYFEDAYRCTRA